MLALILVLAWAFFGAIAYLLLRRMVRRELRTWTVGDRLSGILFFAFGPMGFLTACLMAVMVEVLSVFDFDKPAKW